MGAFSTLSVEALHLHLSQAPQAQTPSLQTTLEEVSQGQQHHHQELRQEHLPGLTLQRQVPQVGAGRVVVAPDTYVEAFGAGLVSAERRKAWD